MTTVEKIAKHNGAILVESKLAEECCELARAIIRHDRANILEEIADVELMLAQWRHLAEVDTLGEVDRIFESKVKRTVERLGI